MIYPILEPETGIITPLKRNIVFKDPKSIQDLTDQRLRILVAKSVRLQLSLYV